MMMRSAILSAVAFFLCVAPSCCWMIVHASRSPFSVAQRQVNGYRLMPLAAGFGYKIAPASRGPSPNNNDFNEGAQSRSSRDVIDTIETAEGLMRARYDAYARQDLDFIIDSTSPTCPDYEAYYQSAVAPKNARSRWIRDLRRNMVDAYTYVWMEVDSVVEEVPNERAIVSFRHLAIRSSDDIMFPIAETATVVKVSGRWLFESTQVSRPDPDTAGAMMKDWPALGGYEFKPRNQ
jgi:uncharacterized protein YchJ